MVAIVAAGYYFLPETTGNIFSLAREYEAQVPAIWEARQKLEKGIREAKQEIAKEVEQSSEKLSEANK